jgi:hypothetical protein
MEVKALGLFEKVEQENTPPTKVKDDEAWQNI